MMTPRSVLGRNPELLRMMTPRSTVDIAVGVVAAAVVTVIFAAVAFAAFHLAKFW
jgi:hypothetical protein